MEEPPLNAEIQETHAASSQSEGTEKKTSRYDDPFYKSIFGAFEGPPDLSSRAREIFGEIMDEKYKATQSGSNTMTLTLTPSTEARLRTLAQRRGQSPEEVIDALVQREMAEEELVAENQSGQHRAH